MTSTSKGRYRSKFESNIAKKLKKLGIRFEYETVVLPYTRKQTIPKATRELHNLSDDFVSHTYHVYTVDFWLPDLGIAIEAKGRWVPKDRTKMREIVEQHPDLNIKMWFQRDDYIHPGSKSRYTDVSKKLGMESHVGLTTTPGYLKK